MATISLCMIVKNEFPPIILVDLAAIILLLIFIGIIVRRESLSLYQPPI